MDSTAGALAPAVLLALYSTKKQIWPGSEMAFCTNCGKSLQDGARFCTNCGSAVQITVPTPSVAPNLAPAAAPAIEPPVTSAAIPEVPQVAVEPSAPPAAPSVSAFADLSAQSQSSTSPIFIIICAVLFLLIVGGIGGTAYLQRQGKAKAAESANQTATEQSAETSPSTSSVPASVPSSVASSPVPVTSGAASTMSAPPPAAPVADSVRMMNLGNYPGATPVAIATLTGETVVAGFLTRDTPQQVIQYYKVRFPVSTTAEEESKVELSATLPGGQRIRIQAQPQGTSTQVMVLQER